jgi:hypothetical protein
MVRSLSDAEALLILPVGVSRVLAGSVVTGLELA